MRGWGTTFTGSVSVGVTVTVSVTVYGAVRRLRKISQGHKIPRLCPELFLERDGKRPPGADYSRYLGYGATWALSTLLFLWLGTKADAWLGIEPALTLVGAFVGAAAGFYYMYSNLVGDQKKKR